MFYSSDIYILQHAPFVRPFLTYHATGHELQSFMSAETVSGTAPYKQLVPVGIH